MIKSAPKFDASWLETSPMHRIVIHWTAGGPEPNASDVRHYHFLIDQTGHWHRGIPEIAHNVPPLRPGYAAHTRNLNSHAIGIALCGMAGARERPFSPGNAPLQKVQFDALAKALPVICDHYQIPIAAKTVLTHAEVQPTLGVLQAGKWDITRFPWDDQHIGARVVGDMIRKAALAAAKRGSDELEAEPFPEGATLAANTKELSFYRDPGKVRTGGVPRDTLVTLLEDRGKWLKVLSPANYSGYVNRDHVRLVDGPRAESPTEPDPERTVIQAIIDWLMARLTALILVPAVIVYFALAAPALAQVGDNGVIYTIANLSIAAIATLGAIAIPLITAWFRAFIQRHTTLDEEQITNLLGDRLDKALQMAVTFAVNQIALRLGHQPDQSEIYSAKVIDDAESYVRKAVPQTIQRLGIGTDVLRSLITARLPSL